MNLTIDGNPKIINPNEDTLREFITQFIAAKQSSFTLGDANSSLRVAFEDVGLLSLSFTSDSGHEFRQRMFFHPEKKHITDICLRYYRNTPAWDADVHWTEVPIEIPRRKRDRLDNLSLLCSTLGIVVFILGIAIPRASNFDIGRILMAICIPLFLPFAFNQCRRWPEVSDLLKIDTIGIFFFNAALIFFLLKELILFLNR